MYGEELAKKVDVCFLAITDIEYDTVVGVFENMEEVIFKCNDIRRISVGYRGDTLCLVGQAKEKRAFRGYGASSFLFDLAESCRFFYKIGGAAGHNEIGTISILCRGLDGVVLHGKTVPVVYYAYCSLCKLDQKIGHLCNYLGNCAIP
jgi:hypothetical protein